MDKNESLISYGNIGSQTDAILDCNKISAQYGLTLSPEQVQELINSRSEVLTESGRIEFGGSVLPNLIGAFCDSGYITQEDYLQTLIELQEAFYFFKNDSDELISDDELIEFMHDKFEGVCQGSVEYMSQMTLDDLCRNTRYGYKTDEERMF